MKNIFTQLTAKFLLAGAVCILLISSCRKTEFSNPIGPKKVPVSAESHIPTIPTLTVTLTHTITPTTSTVTTTGTTTVTSTGTNTETPTGTNTETPTKTCPSVNYPIWAGAGGNDTTKATKVGNVSYSNDGVNLYVTSTFSGPTCPTEIQVWAGSDLSTMPKSSGGVPFGQFPYQLNPASCGTHTFTIPLKSLFPAGTTNFCNKNLYVVLHAAMGADASIEGSTEQTAIGYGSQTFGGPRWGWIATYPICCPN